MDRDSDPSGPGRHAAPRHRSPREAPAAPGDARSQARPEARTEAPRPRPEVPATTGQLPVARTRRTASGPHGTAPIAVIRTAPPVPRVPSGASDRRLRTFEESRAQPQPQPRQQPLRPRVEHAPVPPRPADFAPAPVRGRPRRPARALATLLAVAGMTLVVGLPSVATESSAAPPVRGVQEGDLQHLDVSGEVSSSGASLDAVSDAMAQTTSAPGWIKPVDGTIGDPFGPRPIQPVPGVNLFHRGQDLVAACGSEIHAASAGTVESAGWWGTYGNWILIDHGDGVETGYAHEERMLVTAGQKVREGQLIGLVGETGAATGCHLHLEVHLNGVAVNPVPFFAAKGTPLG